MRSPKGPTGTSCRPSTRSRSTTWSTFDSPTAGCGPVPSRSPTRVRSPVTDQDQAAPEQAPADPADDMPYEAARDELIEVVRRLEAGGTSVEESLALWERGEALAEIWQQWIGCGRGG